MVEVSNAASGTDGHGRVLRAAPLRPSSANFGDSVLTVACQIRSTRLPVTCGRPTTVPWRRRAEPDDVPLVLCLPEAFPAAGMERVEFCPTDVQGDDLTQRRWHSPVEAHDEVSLIQVVLGE